MKKQIKFYFDCQNMNYVDTLESEHIEQIEKILDNPEIDFFSITFKDSKVYFNKKNICMFTISDAT